MRMFAPSCLLLFLLLTHWSQVDGLCHLPKSNVAAADCLDLEDARYIDTYHLHILRAPSFSKVLSPGNFRNLTSLRHLDLSGGNIERIKSDSFAKLVNLQTLNLAENHIGHFDTGAFDGLKHLHSLKLGKNAITKLPAALISLKELRLLDLSDNPLDCNCASLKLRDALLARGVKISKKSVCSKPAVVKNMSFLKPDTKTTCVFESQDLEMQADQAVEGSGELEDSSATIDEEEGKDVEEGETKTEQPEISEDEESKKVVNSENNNESETEAAQVTSEEISSTTAASSPMAEDTSEVPSSTAAPKDDITFEDTEDSSKTEPTTEISLAVSEKSEDSTEKSDDLIIPELVPTEEETNNNKIQTSKSTPLGIQDDLIVPYEGSGESDDDGSGLEGSGMIVQMPRINFNETVEGEAEEEGEEVPAPGTSTTTTTTSSPWDWNLPSLFNSWNPFKSDPTESPVSSTTEKSANDDLKEEQFIEVKEDLPRVEDAVVTKVPLLDESSFKQSPRTSELPEDEMNNSLNVDIDENSVDPAYSQETKKGIGSYVVLATLLAILAALIGLAAYKGDFCRKKRKRRDVERGTEMKDMQKTLLEQNTTQPKIHASNGNTMENVPLMNSSALPEEPREKQRSYDISPAVTNGTNHSNGLTAESNDPVKPPRKLGQLEQIEAPLNGLNPPMDDIDASTRNSFLGGSNEMLNGDCCERPPLSPSAQRVKITLQENPDSVPKTPILITRLKAGENLVKTP